ncbi:MAG: class I mannose-6-phosphate isomerase [Clostridia bacterium]|nr:class I mannose-6-phosphate isomerase [Clostridia bacterium]
MNKYPLKVSYTAKSAIWGGQVLARDWHKQGEGENIAETWELSVRPKEMATVLNGEAEGMTLEAYIEACGADCVSPTYQIGDRFPLLVKLIDASDRLSVQVHPDDAYASQVEHDSGKTEMWYIVAAEPGASIVYGLRDGVSREDFARAVEERRLDEVMNTCPVLAGESYFIPAGMVHAIGAGILIAEIQQNSDLTYRVYDYDRRQADGSLRPLHTEKALEVIRPYTQEQIDEIAFARGRGKGKTELLANSRYFQVEKREIRGGVSDEQGRGSFASLLCLKGEGELIFEGERFPIGKGDSYFLPAGMGKYRLKGTMTLIHSEL